MFLSLSEEEKNIPFFFKQLLGESVPDVLKVWVAELTQLLLRLEILIPWGVGS